MRVPPQVATSRKYIVWNSSISYGITEEQRVRLVGNAIPHSFPPPRGSRSCCEFDTRVLIVLYAESHNICVEIYRQPRISQCDFPVMRFVQHKSTETKMINKFLSSHMGTSRQACHKAGHARRKEKNGKSEKKKMWVHLVCN